MSNMSADDRVPVGVIGLGMMGRPMASASAKSNWFAENVGSHLGQHGVEAVGPRRSVSTVSASDASPIVQRP